jgi:hypothetical protein
MIIRVSLTLMSSQFILLRKARVTLLLSGGAHEQIFYGTHNVDHGYGMIDKVDPMEGTIYWRFKTIHNITLMRLTLFLWNGMVWPSQTTSLGLSEKTCVSLIVRKITWRMRS